MLRERKPDSKGDLLYNFIQRLTVHLAKSKLGLENTSSVARDLGCGKKLTIKG